MDGIGRKTAEKPLLERRRRGFGFPRADGQLQALSSQPDLIAGIWRRNHITKTVQDGRHLLHSFPTGAASVNMGPHTALPPGWQLAVKAGHKVRVGRVPLQPFRQSRKPVLPAHAMSPLIASSFLRARDSRQATEPGRSPRISAISKYL